MQADFYQPEEIDNMIGYVTLGTNDLDRAVGFYEQLLSLLDCKRNFESDNAIGWGGPNGEPGVAVTQPHDKQPATVGNGVMVALSAPSPEVVDRVHARALELGGTDEGAPGPRGDHFYGGYFRDLDGNKLNAFCIV